MKKKIAVMVLGFYLTGAFGAAYASPSPAGTTENGPQVSIVAIKDTAGVLPNSHFYSIERRIEQLQIAITQSEEKLAAVKAQLATERAAEAAIMADQGKEELAGRATAEYMEVLASAAEHINNAIEAKNEAAQTLNALNEAYRRSEDILKIMIEKAPEGARGAIESALNEQGKAIAAVNGFYAAKNAFFAAKKQLEEAKRELEAAKRSGDEEAIRVAEEKVRNAEALKDELEALKDSADSAKEEVKRLAEKANKEIELGTKQVEKASREIEKLEEKASDNEKKIKEKAIKAEEKEREKAKKEEEKAREEIKKSEEKAREKAEKAAEKARKETEPSTQPEIQ
ncbi:MAG: DUF5667 domain-containing protein [Bacillota bacterium]